MIRVVLPAHLRNLANAPREVEVDCDGVDGPTIESLLDAIEVRYPVLRGTIRDTVSGQRRPFVRYFACENDLSHEVPSSLLPTAVTSGAEPFFVIGAMAGG